MYELPIAQETVKLVMYEDNQNPIKSIKTGDNGQFELTQVIQQKDFIEFNSQTISVQASYFYPMSIAKMELLTNKVGYFEFNLELDYFEVIIVDLIITNEGYKTYKASEDPQFAKDKGIALFDKYSFTFFNSIKLEKL